jgi:cell cycle checkpoint protein
MSDATMRGDSRDELLTSGGAGGYAWSRERNDILDIRTALPRDLLMGPYVTQIAYECLFSLLQLHPNGQCFGRFRFNPIAQTLMKKALTALVNRHFSKSLSSSSHSHTVAPTKDIIDAIVQSSNGDIRSAIMALQFNSVASQKSKKGKKRSATSTAILEATTKRESSLALFHLIGRVLYNKRAFSVFDL